MSVEPVAALFVMARSAYHELEGVDCWDQARDFKAGAHRFAA